MKIHVRIVCCIVIVLLLKIFRKLWESFEILKSSWNWICCLSTTLPPPPESPKNLKYQKVYGPARQPQRGSCLEEWSVSYYVWNIHLMWTKTRKCKHCTSRSLWSSVSNVCAAFVFLCFLSNWELLFFSHLMNTVLDYIVIDDDLSVCVDAVHFYFLVC